jgi:hypothetical protein
MLLSHSGIMEAANRGAADIGASSIGFNITKPHEQAPNPYITPKLSFRFHYFAMRKCIWRFALTRWQSFPAIRHDGRIVRVADPATDTKKRLIPQLSLRKPLKTVGLLWFGAACARTVTMLMPLVRSTRNCSSAYHLVPPCNDRWGDYASWRAL